MIEDMELRNLAPKTIEVYVQRVAAFARHFGRSPEDLGPDQVRSYLVYLVQERQVSWSYYNQTVAALRFLYEVTLERQGVMQRIRCPKQPKKLPVVLSPDEVTRVFAAVASLKHRVLLMTAYAAGLRVSEVAALRVDDVDSQRMVLRVRQASGRKDRYVMLSPRLLVVLREYWKTTRPTDWLFPGEIPGRSLTEGSIQRVCVNAGRAASSGSDLFSIVSLPSAGGSDAVECMARRPRFQLPDAIDHVSPVATAVRRSYAMTSTAIGACLCRAELDDDDQRGAGCRSGSVAR
jgi:integrase